MSSSKSPINGGDAATGLVSPFAYATQPNDDVSAASISLPATTPHVDSYKISKLDEARQRIKQSFSSQFSSPLLSNSDTVEYIFPRFDKSELILGNVLGCGGFGTVLEIRAIRLLSSEGGGGFEGDDEDGAGREIGEGFDDIARNKNCSNDNDSDINRQDGGRRTFKTMCPNFFHWRHAKEEQHEEERGDFVFTGEGGEGEGKNNYGNNSDDDAVKGRRRGEEGAPPIEDEQQQQRQVGDKQIRKRQVSRNFSIQAWIDSDPGEEGNDAISQEEMKRYKSEYSSSRGGTTEHSGVSSTGEDGDGDFNLAHCLGDVCPGATLSTVLEKSERASQFSIYETTVVVGHTTKTNGDGGANVCDDDADEGGSHQHQQHQQRRRIVFFKPEDKLDHDIIQQDKQYISENATTREGESRYAIKIIQPDIVQSDFKKFLQAAMDMATETYFLSVLRHPHILKMRAVGQGDMFSPDYFLVLDRLYDTLLDRIEGSWTETANHLEKDFFVWSRTKKVKLFWAERVGVMRDIAAALAYMHDLRIIYRDIKPENIGFDSKGIVKLFDFGLAKEVRKEDESSNGTYKLTAETGSLRYMAPEVGNKWPYNFLADSYSFGIMLWEVTALARPFATYTPNEIRDMVMKWGERPKIKDIWPARVKELMTSAWDSSFKKRPTMETFRDALEQEAIEAIL